MLNFEQIKEIIPQRFPMLMIDRVLDYKKEESLTAIKNVTINEAFFQGHFPGRPVMPGNLISEAAAQTAIVLYHVSKNEGNAALIYLLGSVKADFHHPVVPGDQLRIEASVKRLLADGGYIANKIFVKDKLVAGVDIIFKVIR